MSSLSLGNMNGVALITGAASGIGRECALAFARCGSKLVLVDRNLEGLKALKKQLRLPEDRIIIEQIDVTNIIALAHFIRTIPERLGGIHFLIQCSGILGPDYDVPLHELPEKHWSLVLDINLKAPALITREVVRLMLKQEPLPSLLEKEEGRKAGTCTRRGVIINLGSSASLRARSASGAPYITSKHGLIGLTKVTAVSYGGQGIRCNALAPGFVATPLVAGIASKVEQVAREVVPQRRVAEAVEIADMALFLCSERANYSNGSIITMDGGWSAT